MSKTYTVKKFDAFYLISTKFYGVPNKHNEIIAANPQFVGRKTIAGLPDLIEGEILIIPDLIKKPKSKTTETIQEDTITPASPDAISILVDGKLFSFFTDYSITFNIDTFDTFTFSGPFDETKLVYRETFRPFSYKKAKVYYDKYLIFTGVLLAQQCASNPDSKTLSISGYSLPGVLNDCHMPISAFPLNFNNQTLQQITEKVCKPYGIISNFLSSSGNKFSEVALEVDKPVLSFLIDLATQRGLLVSNNEKGELIFWKSGTGSPIASFKEGELPFISCSPQFNYQNFFSHITAISKTTESDISGQKTYINNYLLKRGINRHYNFIVEDAKISELASIAKIKAGQMFGESASYGLSVKGHRDKNGNLYKKNLLVSVHSPGAMIYKESNMLIKSLTMSRKNEGDITDFSLILPGCYTGEIPEVFPWEE